jgi:hypothetical protein
MSWQTYRPGEGRWGRFAAFAVILGMAAFGAYRWHLWASPRTWLPWLGHLPLIGRHELNWGEIGAAVILIVSALISYRKPMFRMRTELWGSAYVVILVVAALTLFIGAVDYLFMVGADWVFLK